MPTPLFLESLSGRRPKPGAPHGCIGFTEVGSWNLPYIDCVCRLGFGGLSTWRVAIRAFTASIPEILKFFGEPTAGAGGQDSRLRFAECTRWTIPNEHRCLSSCEWGSLPNSASRRGSI